MGLYVMFHDIKVIERVWGPFRLKCPSGYPTLGALRLPFFTAHWIEIMRLKTSADELWTRLWSTSNFAPSSLSVALRSTIAQITCHFCFRCYFLLHWFVKPSELLLMRCSVFFHKIFLKPSSDIYLLGKRELVRNFCATYWISCSANERVWSHE